MQIDYYGHGREDLFRLALNNPDLVKVRGAIYPQRQVEYISVTPGYSGPLRGNDHLPWETRLAKAGPEQVRGAWRVAFHEAGHFVASYLDNMPVNSLRLEMGTVNGSDYISGGWCAFAYEGSLPGAYAAGAAAERLFGLKNAWPSKPDILGFMRATESRGLKSSDMALEAEIRRMEGVLAPHWSALDAIASRLVRVGELSGAECEAIARAEIRKAA